MNRYFTSIAILVAVAFLAVGATCQKPSKPLAVCQEVPGPSLLEEYIPDLRLADTLFKLSTLQIGKLDKVKQKDILKVLDEADAMLVAGTTYGGLVMYLLPKFKWLQENVGAEIVIVGQYLTDFQDVATPVGARDICYLRTHIDSQRKTVLPWIKK